MLELQQAIKAEDATFQAREVAEVQETLDDFLKLASTKYDVKKYKKPVALTDAEQFGIFGCQFYGKVRAEGSNKCIEQTP